MAAAYDELVEGTVLFTGESWQGINNIDVMLEELKDEIANEIPNLINNRFDDTDWMEIDH